MLRAWLKMLKWFWWFGAREVLAWADKQGIQQFVYTHKGDNALTILLRFGVDAYFTEILTSQSGFARKPSPEAATYLISKYQPDRTFYIGDRTLDRILLQNSSIQSINFLGAPRSQRQISVCGYSFSLYESLRKRICRFVTKSYKLLPNNVVCYRA